MSQNELKQGLDQKIDYTVQEERELAIFTDLVFSLDGAEEEKSLLVQEKEQRIRQQALSRKLLSSVNRDCYQSAKMAIDWGADINSQSEFGNTPLMFAASRGNLKMVKLILSCPGVNLGIQNKCGDTALKIAMLRGNKEIIEVIKKAQRFEALVDKQRCDGRSIKELDVLHTR